MSGLGPGARRPASVDLAVSFAVLEHVEDPVGLLRDIRELLRPGATLWVSTPNSADAMLELLPDVYAGFFYRSAHAHYFDGGFVSPVGARFQSMLTHSRCSVVKVPEV